MKEIFPLVGLIATVGCAQQSISASSGNPLLDKIADGCGLERSAFILRGEKNVEFRPPAESKYEAVDCALREFEKAHTGLIIGFVGNEAPSWER